MGLVGSVSQLAPPQMSQQAPACQKSFEKQYFDFEKLDPKN